MTEYSSLATSYMWIHLFVVAVIRFIDRTCHRSPMQTEKFQPEGKRIMPETRFTEFPKFSVDPRAGLSQSASSFRNFPLGRGLGFLGLHRRPMFDCFSYL